MRAWSAAALAQTVLCQSRSEWPSPLKSFAVPTTGIVDYPAPMKMVYDPTNAAANSDGYVTMPNVDPVREMVNMISASRSYQANVETMNTAKTLLLKTLTIGQT